MISEQGLRRQAEYEYNGQNRMIYSRVSNTVERSRVTSRYAYDALGRRTVEQDEGGSPVRTLYDGLSFEAVRSGVTFNDGRFTTRHSEGIQRPADGESDGMRYRWISGEGSDVRTRSAGGEYGNGAVRYTGISVTLYGKGEAVGMNRSAGGGSRGGPAYLGKDLLGSVRSATNEYGVLEERYEYDAFGKPYKGDLENGMNLGYTGKPYDSATGLYDYGYRDYKPEAARFTTEDPIRDGSNWFVYVNNDPVNWIDFFGLETTVMITHADVWWENIVGGSHVAVHMSNPASDEKSTLYDPSGSYFAKNEGGSKYRPSSGAFWGEPDSNKDAYIEYESRNGQYVTTYTLSTTPKQESMMIKLAFELGDGFGFSCAYNVSSVLEGVGINIVWTPGGLEKQLEKMVKDGTAIKNCGK